MKSDLEKALGGTLQSTADVGIAGLTDTKNTETIFFEIPTGDWPREVFVRLTNASDPPIARSGGAYEYGSSITTPDGEIYHALQTHGDIDGWRKDIKLGAAQHRISLGKVYLRRFSLAKENRRRFVVDRGRRSYPLSECDVAFF